MKRLTYILFLACIPFLISCEVEVDLQLQDAPPILIFDAWINNKPEDQVIRITRSQPYFDDNLPPGVSGAIVSVTDDLGNTYDFNETANGEYRWTYAGVPLGAIGREFTLSVNTDGQEFRAESQMNRVPAMDSVVFNYREDEDEFREAGYYGEFYATDFTGPGDAYWIKTWKNEELLLRPFEINIAYDAGFSAGGNIDGVVFIQPIQDAVNPLNDDLSAVIPYIPGDSMYVEIHSITVEAYDFLSQMAIQTQRDGGFDEIFAEPLENLPTNIVRTAGDSDEAVAGFFTVSAVSGDGKRLDP